jgi:proteic killer suppression protein
MEIESIRHKGLRQYAETGNHKGLVGDPDRIRNMLAYIAAIEAEDELLAPPNFGAHKLKGNRKELWALTVSKNWRMTFKVIDGVIHDMDLEDYH